MEHSILRKNFSLGLSALAVCIVLALFAPWVAERLTTPPEAYVYQSGDNYFLVFPDGKTIPLPVMKKFSGFRFSPDGKYLYLANYSAGDIAEIALTENGSMRNLLTFPMFPIKNMSKLSPLPVRR